MPTLGDLAGMNVSDYMSNYKPSASLNAAAYAGMPGFAARGNEVPYTDIDQANAALAEIQKHDPNASLQTLTGTTYSNETGSGQRPDQYVINADWSKIPQLQNTDAIASQQKALETGDYKQYGLSQFDPSSPDFKNTSKFGAHQWLTDPSKVFKDPTYGDITPAGNLHQYYSGTKNDMYNDMIGHAILAMAVGGMGAGAFSALGGGLPGALGSFGLKQGVNAAEGGSFNPMSLTSLLGAIPGMDQIMPYLSLAQNAYGASKGNIGAGVNTVGGLAKMNGFNLPDIGGGP